MLFVFWVQFNHPKICKINYITVHRMRIVCVGMSEGGQARLAHCLTSIQDELLIIFCRMNSIMHLTSQNLRASHIHQLKLFATEDWCKSWFRSITIFISNASKYKYFLLMTVPMTLILNINNVTMNQAIGKEISACVTKFFIQLLCCKNI